MTPYLFITLPIAGYMALFMYETYASFRRLAVPASKGGTAYVHATWEVTHTFLIIGVTNFIWLFSDVAREVSRAVYWGLIVAGACFIIRATLYTYIFYVRPSAHQRTGFLDWLFALSHIGILAGLIYTLSLAVLTLADTPYKINSQFVPWMWPGLVLLGALGLIPLYQLYRTKD